MAALANISLPVPFLVRLDYAEVSPQTDTVCIFARPLDARMGDRFDWFAGTASNAARFGPHQRRAFRRPVNVLCRKDVTITHQFWEIWNQHIRIIPVHAPAAAQLTEQEEAAFVRDLRAFGAISVLMSGILPDGEAFALAHAETSWLVGVIAESVARCLGAHISHRHAWSRLHEFPAYRQRAVRMMHGMRRHHLEDLLPTTPVAQFDFNREDDWTDALDSILLEIIDRMSPRKGGKGEGKGPPDAGPPGGKGDGKGKGGGDGGKGIDAPADRAPPGPPTGEPPSAAAASGTADDPRPGTIHFQRLHGAAEDQPPRDTARSTTKIWQRPPPPVLPAAGAASSSTGPSTVNI